MAKSSKRELGVELEKLIDATFAKFERYLPGPQDAAVYRRKRREYLDEIAAILRERGGADGRDDSSSDE